MIGLAHRGARLNDPSDHLVSTLKPAGYYTARVGVQHIAYGDGPWPDYDEVLDVVGHSNSIVDGGREFVNRPHAQPFFLACGLFETHRYEHWHARQAPLGDARYVRPPACLPDTPRTRADFADYVAAAHKLDGHMGDVIDAIDAAGLGEDTLVIVTTDHGIAFPHMKCSLTDHGQGVMLMVRGPGFRGGRVIDPAVTHLDIFPTLCDMIGVEPPTRLRGKSLLPLVRGEVDRLHRATFGTVNFHAAYEPKRAIRTDRFRYVRRLRVLPHQVLPNTDDSESKQQLIDMGWPDVPQEAESLYDRAFDPNEVHNLIDHPGYADTLADLRTQLEAWRRETGDPWLDAEPDCSQMQVNADSAVSPSKEPLIPYERA